MDKRFIIPVVLVIAAVGIFFLVRHTKKKIEASKADALLAKGIPAQIVAKMLQQEIDSLYTFLTAYGGNMKNVIANSPLENQIKALSNKYQLFNFSNIQII
jgi:hypothetical protein